MSEQDLLGRIELDLLSKYPRDRLKEYRLLPISMEDGYILFVSDQKPPLPVIDQLQVYGSIPVEVKMIAGPAMDQMINEYLEAPLETVEGMMDDLHTVSEDFADLDIDNRIENLEELAQEAPIIRLVNAIITTALKKNASDIHLEPYENSLKLRYRVDGILFDNPAPPRKLFPAIVTRIKIMAGLNIAERRLPQEGRIRIRVLGRELDIRVSTMATLYGESVVLRLLDRADVLLNLRNLGFASDVLDHYYRLVGLSHGIILVTGPTGSGKTTTLYATLDHLNTPEKKIVTIEDPVEYQLYGINQIQVKPEIEFTFSRGLRSILRQDPDIIMIGEIRDIETASIAIQAALTGHLVFATLHTNDAAGAIIRLLDMGVEDYLLSATLKGVLAQRLVRLLCTDCREEYTPARSELDLSSLGYNGSRIYRANGCEECSGIGYSGRTGIYELLVVEDEIERLIHNTSNISVIRDTAENLGVRSLFSDGLDKVEQGFTTIDEVLRVTRT
ncbi:MAG: type II secretion system ATPase GspE [Halanaerobiales bacterium]